MRWNTATDLLLHPGRELAAGDELPNVREIPGVGVVMVVMTTGRWGMGVGVRVVGCLVLGSGFWVRLQMHLELCAGDAAPGLATDVEVIAVELEFSEFALQARGVNAQVEQRGDQHVASNAAEQV
jgi:hypothetical protein